MLNVSSSRGQMSQMRISTVGKRTAGRRSHHNSLPSPMNSIAW